jgi:hypothetical protein
MVTMKKRLRPSSQEYYDEIRQMILAKFPDAEFDLIRRRRNEITVDVTSNVGDMLELIDLVAERTTDILIESGVHIVVVPMGRRDNQD